MTRLIAKISFEHTDLTVRGRLCRVAQVDGDGYKFLTNPESAIATLRGSNTRADLFTFLQSLPAASPRYPYSFEWDNLAVLPVSTFDHWWTRQVDAKTRNMVRRADKKGVLVREVPFDGSLVRGIWEIYNECSVRQGKPFPHYGKDMETIWRMSKTFLESSVFIGAFLNNQLIGFVKLTIDETQIQAGVMHILAMVQHRDKAPTNALIAESVKSCTRRNIPFLVYSNFAYGKKVRSSLSDFKENNGFTRVDIPRYYVPLTPWGAVAFRLGLHRRLAERVPEPVAARLRELRNHWYLRRSHSNAESF